MKWIEKDLEAVLMRSLSMSFPRKFYLRKTHPDKYEGAGKPDFVGHIIGMHVEIELKVSPNRPSPQQRAEIRKVNHTGGFACVIIHMRKEDNYYLIMEDSASDFSYKKREGWVHLPHSGDTKKDRFINLKPLGGILMTRKHGNA